MPLTTLANPSNDGEHNPKLSKTSASWFRKFDQQALPTNLDKAFSTLANCVNWLVQKATQGTAEEADFHRLRIILAALPLTCDQFSLCTLRLKNAMAYYGARERNAAVYELQLLNGGFGIRPQ